MIKDEVLDYLKTQDVEDGQDVIYRWFTFRVTGSDGKWGLETLDFQNVASFTDDFSLVEEINEAQNEVLTQCGIEESQSNLQQYALVSKSFKSDISNVCMFRMEDSDERDSGWFIGIADDPLDVDDAENLEPMSLYELSLIDSRLLPYWLLPKGCAVYLEGDDVEVTLP